MDIVTLGSTIAQGRQPAHAIASSSTSGTAQQTKSTLKSDDQATPVAREQLDTAVKAVNAFIQPINNDLQFSIDEDTGKTVVKVIDINTKEIIKQFPSEEMLAIAKALDGLKGLLVQQKA